MISPLTSTRFSSRSQSVVRLCVTILSVAALAWNCPCLSAQERVAGASTIGRSADRLDHRVDHVERLDQTLDDVEPGEVRYEVRLAGFKPMEVSGVVKPGEARGGGLENVDQKFYALNEDCVASFK